MEKFAKYIKKAKKLGAKDAKVILARSVVTAEWVRLKCRFGCGGYARSLTCPPYSPTPEETGRMLKEYKRALLVHGDRYADMREIVTALEREAFLDGYWKAFAMASGPCEYCKTCGEHCRHPRKARPSMEACGIDVFTTVRANGFPIEVVRSRSCKANYYCLLLLE
jgi:predicted metal-binding protein